MQFEKRFIDHSPQSLSRSGSPERLQQLRSKADRFTASYAEQQRDYATRVEKGEDRGKLPYDPKLERSVDEHRKPTDKVIIPDKEGLFAGAMLKDHHWDELKRRLELIRSEFNSGVGKSTINKSLDQLRNMAHKYIGKGDDDDETWLKNIKSNLPENADEASFLEGIRLCLENIESATR